MSGRFKKWLAQNVTTHDVSIETPTDYRSIFQVSQQTLALIEKQQNLRSHQLCIHLSPGTPAMTAIWVLLGKSRYPATFYQSFAGKAWETEIPFDLAVDYVPELLKTSDSSLQHLFSRSPQEIEGFQDIIGKSQTIRLAVGRAQKAAIRDVPVLILGETGTGKELFAHAIHQASHRKDGPFIAINCAAMPKDLLESELFGHTKGAFTGADKSRSGAFELADLGTLFLDEFGECGPEMQAKLLRALQPPPGKGPCHRVYQRLGETRERHSDVRVVAATNRDLIADIRENRFREDLYYRLAMIVLNLPPLRQRKSDIPLLCNTLLEQINLEFAQSEPGYVPKKISKSAMEEIKRYPWPGNIRQLYSALVQASVMAGGDSLKTADFREAIEQSVPSIKDVSMDIELGNGFSIDQHVDDIRLNLIEKAMSESKGVVAQAARLLGVQNYQTLNSQMERLGINKKRWKS